MPFLGREIRISHSLSFSTLGIRLTFQQDGPWAGFFAMAAQYSVSPGAHSHKWQLRLLMAGAMADSFLWLHYPYIHCFCLTQEPSGTVSFLSLDQHTQNLSFLPKEKEDKVCHCTSVAGQWLRVPRDTRGESGPGKLQCPLSKRLRTGEVWE